MWWFLCREYDIMPPQISWIFIHIYFTFCNFFCQITICHFFLCYLKSFCNKKVLLRERKRHTARRVVSTPSVVLPGYPPRGGYPDLGTPPGGTQIWVPPSPPGGSRYPPGGSGYPLGGSGYPPRGGGTRTWVPPGGWVRVPPGGGTRTWVPPPVDRQTPVKTVPSRRTTYAGGNKRSF